MHGSGYSIVSNTIIGITGAIIGGFLASALFNIPNPVNGVNISSILVCVPWLRHPHPPGHQAQLIAGRLGCSS